VIVDMMKTMQLQAVTILQVGVKFMCGQDNKTL
jgi:hypothetical protein